MQRIGSIIAIRPDRVAEYKQIHAAIWPEVADKIADCNIRNYTIFLREPENLLFAVYDYHGTDHAADMARMAADPKTQQWWEVCMPMQAPLETRGKDEWWAPMQQVFHQD